LALFMRGAIGKYLFVVSFVAGLFLATFAGTRAGLALAGICIAILITRKVKYIVVAVVIISTLVLIPSVTDFIGEESVTVQRLSDKRSNVVGRLTANYFAMAGNFIKVHGISGLIAGGGFYAVPMPKPSGEMKYRVGYGLHNIHFFPLEQAGILGFLAGIYFWYVALNAGIHRLRVPLARAGFAIAFGLVTVGWTGQIFYFGFGTVHMVAALVSFMALLLWNPVNSTPQPNDITTHKPAAARDRILRRATKKETVNPSKVN